MSYNRINIKYQNGNLDRSALDWDVFWAQLIEAIEVGRSAYFVVCVPSPMSKRLAEQWAQEIEKNIVLNHNCKVYYTYYNATYTADLGDDYFREVTYSFLFSVE